MSTLLYLFGGMLLYVWLDDILIEMVFLHIADAGEEILYESERREGEWGFKYRVRGIGHFITFSKEEVRRC